MNKKCVFKMNNFSFYFRAHVTWKPPPPPLSKKRGVSVTEVVGSLGKIGGGGVGAGRQIQQTTNQSVQGITDCGGPLWFSLASKTRKRKKEKKKKVKQ